MGLRDEAFHTRRGSKQVALNLHFPSQTSDHREEGGNAMAEMLTHFGFAELKLLEVLNFKQYHPLLKEKPQFPLAGY